VKAITLYAGLVLVAGSAAGQYLDESFESMTNCMLSTQPGWQASYAGPLPIVLSGVVTNRMPHSGTRAVELPLNGSLFGSTSRATYTNFATVAEGGRAAVLRASAWIYRENLLQDVAVRLDRDGNGQILLTADSATGHILLTNMLSGASWDPFHPWVTNEYAQMVIHSSLPAPAM
jgi:hypothetical protein